MPVPRRGRRICTQAGRVVYDREPTPFKWSDAHRIIKSLSPPSLLNLKESLFMFQIYLMTLNYVGSLGPRTLLDLLTEISQDEAKYLTNVVPFLDDLYEIEDELQEPIKMMVASIRESLDNRLIIV